ncbi:MAG: hypothetical protein VCC19_02920, partial [Myxococcota bacterium]
GADRVLAIGASRGTGEIPEAEELQCLELGCSSDLGMMEAIRASERLLVNLPVAARQEVDRFDPSSQARVIGTIFGSGQPVADRSVLGVRPQSWQALEDKMIIDALWDRAGIERAPSEILPAELEALWSAHGRLDAGMGTVWVGDNREGWHGGAKLLRWVRDRCRSRMSSTRRPSCGGAPRRTSSTASEWDRSSAGADDGKARSDRRWAAREVTLARRIRGRADPDLP